MTNSGESFPIPANSNPPGDLSPLRNLSSLRHRMESLHSFLSLSLATNTLLPQRHLDAVSDEISAAIRLVIINGTAILESSDANRSLEIFDDAQLKNMIDPGDPGSIPNPIDLRFVENVNDVKLKSTINTLDLTENELTGSKLELEEVDNEILSEDWDIIELDSVELLAEHAHFCEICGKGFKRDANLRMHMRAHGNQFKTPEALAKPESKVSTENSRVSNNTRFSCPYVGCSRNKKHKKFRPLKSAICVKNHFKRSHCPKMYSCNRCNKKSFSVLADLKSHLKHCGETKWKCSCGTTFSRKDKLFAHMALFEGHMPAIGEEEKEVAPVVVIDDDDDEDRNKEGEKEDSCMDIELFDGLLDGFGDMVDGYNLQDVLGMGSPGGLGTSNEFFNF